MGQQRKRAQAMPKIEPAYKPESEKPYFIKGGAKEDKVVQALHASVVNCLQNKLLKAGIETYNSANPRDIRPDLVVPGAAVFEVKTSSEWADVQQALGQLRIYSQDIHPGNVDSVVKIAALPDGTRKKMVTALRRDGAYVVLWRRSRTGVTFTGLDSIKALIKGKKA